MAPLTAAKANLQRLALVRLIVIGGETAALIYAYYWLQADLRYAGLLTAIALQVAATTFTFWRLRKSWPVTDGEFFAQLLLDVGALSLLLYCSGGATNPFVSYYLVPLAIASAVLPSRYTAALALTCIGAYTALLFFYDPLPLLAPLADTHQHAGHGAGNAAINPHMVGMWCNFALSAALITYVVVRMANALRDQHDELNQRREQALHNEQLLAVATLAAGTAHELGTPLGTMQLLLDDMHSDDSALHADIELLKQQVQSCRATLKNLVATADSHQRQQFPLQPADQFVRAVLERWQIVRPTAQYRLQVESGAPAPALRPDETLRQALINLLNNGVDASPEPLLLALQWDAQNVVLRIRDRGAGVALEIAEQLGKPFVTSKGKGLGLGLFLSHATIERCGGDIRLYNHPEGGTEVVLQLPIAETEHG
jgi:two-component system sensor histidine kinase RegB